MCVPTSCTTPCSPWPSAVKPARSRTLPPGLEVVGDQGGTGRVADGGAGAVQLVTDACPAQPHRAQLTGAMGGEARAKEDPAGHLEETGPQCGPRGSADGGAGAVQLAADACPAQPHRAQLVGAVGGESPA